MGCGYNTIIMIIFKVRPSYVLGLKTKMGRGTLAVEFFTWSFTINYYLIRLSSNNLLIHLKGVYLIQPNLNKTHQNSQNINQNIQQEEKRVTMPLWYAPSIFNGLLEHLFLISKAGASSYFHNDPKISNLQIK